MDFTRGDTVRWSTEAGFCDCEFVGRDGDEAWIITPGSGFRIVSMFDLKPLPQPTPSDTVPEKPKTCGECDDCERAMGNGKPNNGTIRKAMQIAAEAFGLKSGTFNAAGFSNALCKIAGTDGIVDGKVVRAILSGRDDVEFLRPGDSHYRFRDFVEPEAACVGVAKPDYDAILHYLQTSMESRTDVKVTRSGVGYSGRVVSIDPVSKIFRLAVKGRNEPFDWSDLDTTVEIPSAKKAEWKPEVGKECTTTSNARVFVRGLYGSWAWVSTTEDPGANGFTVNRGDLRPIPVESPVKQGDVLHVDFADGQFLIGMATCVEPHRFKLAQGRTRAGNLNGSISDWIDFSLVTIRKLVPATLYDHMKKRLEELRDMPSTGTVTRNVCRNILADLEAYAKEGKP